MRGNWYQISLIFLGVVVSALFAIFFMRELFPEYKIYQNIYVQLETFRSSYTGKPPPPFKKEVKQILLKTAPGSPLEVDRCTSCHVAVQFSHFSPLEIAHDVNGNIIYGPNGIPVKMPNPNYIWTKLEEKIRSLSSQGKEAEAENLKALKTVHVGDHVYDVTKVLRAHPLIGRETRPFEYHPIEEYGCTSCHSGNGRGLVTDRAHGPVFDGQYEEQFMGPKPEFLEKDPENDPQFAYVFNHKPSHRLLFQTEPLYPGALIQAKCVQCHQSSDGIFKDIALETAIVTKRSSDKAKAIEAALENEKKALTSLLQLRDWILTKGYKDTIAQLRGSSVDFTLPSQKMQAANAQLDYVLRASGGPDAEDKANVIAKVDEDITEIVGSEALSKKLFGSIEVENPEISKNIDLFIKENKEDPDAVGSIFTKNRAVEKNKQAMFFVDEAESTIEQTAENSKILSSIRTEIDDLTSNFHKGKKLYFSQACYACHRINGLTRGGVGPELTYAGESYPWFLKESIVWPQADLKTSTMPNFRLDHDEVEDLVTFLLAQHGRSKYYSEAAYRQATLKWEAGEKMPWEKPINPGDLHDLRTSMTVFASEGCAACHRLKGFESNVGYQIEKDHGKKIEFAALYKERQWFQNLFPEQNLGTMIVETLEKNSEEIDHRIIHDVRKGSILEEIEETHPGLIESFYPEFKFASRAKNSYYEAAVAKETDPLKKKAIFSQQRAWKDRLHRVLMMFIQEYGLGRLIGPRPNWSGIYRSDEWLIEHFRKPSRHIAKSIMPVMPFDDSKFYALTYMLDVLAEKNRNAVREIWDTFGFNPALAYHIHCSQCHGEFLHGNGPVSEWIYPIPKNLRNADFLRNYTRENITYSIIHGVKGTPMPPWGEVAKDKPLLHDIPVLSEHEITQLVDWLFSSLLGGTVIRGGEDVPKWQYGPKDVIKELEKEGNTLTPGPPPEFLELKEAPPDSATLNLPSGDELLVALKPVISQKPKVNNQDKEQSVEDIFDISPNSSPGPDLYSYYIKKRFFTQDNIKAGQAFFALNCSVCHGIEADGQGFRAGTMYDAKPRMLTNLNWIETRDDLRLLRSIKYGVTGTAMTPWGDLTSSLQRLQLVIFIRSLSLEQQKRDNLFKALYEVFDRTDQILDRARIAEGKVLKQIEDQLHQIAIERPALIENVETGKGESEAALAIFKQELDLGKELKNHKEADAILIELKSLVRQEEKIYQTVGITLIGKTFIGDTLDKYLKLINVNNGQFKINNGTLEASFEDSKEKKIQELAKEIATDLEMEIKATEKALLIAEAKLPSKERNEEVDHLKSDINGFKQVRASFISGVEEAERLRRSQEDAYKKYLKKTDELKNKEKK